MSGLPVITPVVLVGGGGSRLWPVSTPDRPKQFIPLVGRRTLFAETLGRVAGGAGGDLGFDPPVVVGGARHRQRIAGELAAAGIAGASLILEPFGRNTAPAIAAAALHIAAGGNDRLMLVMPSDHHIADVAAFHRAIAAGTGPAGDRRLVTFGIRPTRPETGYGYIRRGAADGESFIVDRFVEKPAAEVAKRYLEEGGYDWNAGIFLFAAGAILAALDRHAPAILAAARQALDAAARAGAEIVLDRAVFAACPAASIDDAVMAVSEAASVVPVDMGWSDVGSWQALHAIAAQAGDDANVVRGRVITEGVSGSYLRADDGLVAAVGVTGVAVVKAGDAVLVTTLERAQDVRKVDSLVGGLGSGPGPAADDLGDFREAGERLRRWMLDHALPLWAARGWDTEAAGFREDLGPDGEPRPEPFRRLRVQARQIYAFAAAHLIGWDGPALDIAWRGFEHLVARGWLAEGGWAHRLDAGGRVIDPTRDAYDHAFVLYALAWLHRASGAEEPLLWARRTLAWLDAVLVDPVHGGYREAIPDRLPRRANPHMHLLEALIALYDATREAAFLDRAASIVRLFGERLFDPATGTLGEFFTDDWAPEPGAGGKAREPGHHYEWAWLLDAFEARLGRDCGAWIAALVDFADRHGSDDALGLVRDGVDAAGRPLSATHRLWCQTEAVRTRFMLALRGHPGEAAKAAALTEAIFRHHLDTRPAGLWRDTVGADGRPIGTAVPASTLYHLMALVWDVETRMPATEGAAR